MNKKVKEWLIVLATLVDDIVIVAIVLVVLNALGTPITPLIITILILFFIGAFWFMHRLIVPALRRRITTGKEGMTGLDGIVVQTLDPEGLVKIQGEYWQASSNEGLISEGETITVIKANKLLLYVKRKSG